MSDAAGPDPYSPCPCGSGKKYKFCCRNADRAAALQTRPGPPLPWDESDEEPEDDQIGFGGSITAFAQPLIDKSDGSPEQVEWCLSVAMLCWNMALLPVSEQDEFLAEMRATLTMSSAEFEILRRDLIEPMLRRHHEMFPDMPRFSETEAPDEREDSAGQEA